MRAALKKAQDLHREAMDFADQAMLARLRGDLPAARRLTEEAFQREQRAALNVARRAGPEPTRSVLLRSAATLALECDRTTEARRLIDLGLSGDPPREIADELRDVEQSLPRTADLADMVTDPGGLPGSSMHLEIREPFSEYGSDDPAHSSPIFDSIKEIPPSPPFDEDKRAAADHPFDEELERPARKKSQDDDHEA